MVRLQKRWFAKVGWPDDVRRTLIARGTGDDADARLAVIEASLRAEHETPSLSDVFAARARLAREKGPDQFHDRAFPGRQGATAATGRAPPSRFGPGRRLVEQEDLRYMDELAGQPDFLLDQTGNVVGRLRRAQTSGSVTGSAWGKRGRET
jgi:hypothetical protein